MTIELDAPALRIGSVLILEDEPLISAVMEDVLLDLGASKVHVCVSPAHALDVIEDHDLHVAILDVLVGDGTSARVADELDARGVPFFFASATSRDAIEERHRHRPLLGKPFSNAQLTEFVSGTARRAGSAD